MTGEVWEERAAKGNPLQKTKRELLGKPKGTGERRRTKFNLWEGEVRGGAQERDKGVFEVGKKETARPWLNGRAVLEKGVDPGTFQILIRNGGSRKKHRYGHPT